MGELDEEASEVKRKAQRLRNASREDATKQGKAPGARSRRLDERESTKRGSPRPGKAAGDAIMAAASAAVMGKEAIAAAAESRQPSSYRLRYGVGESPWGRRSGPSLPGCLPA